MKVQEERTEKEAPLFLTAEDTHVLYQLITEHSSINFWQYDIQKDIFYNTESSKKAHLGERIISNYINTTLNENLVREDSREEFIQLYKRLKKGEKNVSADVWFRGKEEVEWWCERIFYKTIFDEDGLPVRAIGIGQNITDEIEIRMKQQKYQILLDNTDIIIWEYNAQNHTTACQDTSHYIQLRGGCRIQDAPEKLLKCGAVHLESKDAFSRLYEKIDNGEKYAEDEIHMVSMDGRSVWYRIKLKAITAAENMAVRAIGWAVETTEYKKEEFAFLEETAYLASAPNHTLMAKCRVNLTLNSVDNYTADSNILVDRDSRNYRELIENLCNFCVTREMADNLKNKMKPENLIEGFMEGKREFQVEYIRRIQDEKILWVRTCIKMFSSPEASDILGFLYTYDIDQERTLQMIVDHIADTEFGMIGLLYWKRDYIHCVRHSEMEIKMNEGVDVCYSAGIRKYVEKYMDPEQRDGAEERFRIPAIRKMLEEKSVYTVSYPVYYEGRRFYKRWEFSYSDSSHEVIIITRSDITGLFEEQEQQRENLRNALMQAEQASRAKTDFLSRMSHEIRTPMNAIIGMSTLAAQCVEDTDQVSECISKVGISARFLLSLINDILDMSRIESGKVILKNEKFPFEELIANVNTIIYNQANEKGLDYDCVISSFTDPYYVGDAMKLQQILVNLLGNAVKFTPAGGKTQLIVHQVKKENGKAYMIFTVNDTGVGISDEFKKKIFEPFEQGNAAITTPYQGTGLGLAICKNLVTMMGGTISVNSIEGVGTEFTVNVALGICEEEQQVMTRTSIPFEKLKALIVDDDLIICEHTQGILQEMGVRAEWVSSGRQAVTLVRQKQENNTYFDVVLLDWKMPDMDGIETARQLRTIVGPDVTIIVITAYDWASIEQEAKAAGVNLLITKPLFKSTLMSAFQRIYTEKAQKEEKRPKVNYDFEGTRILLVEDHILNVEVAKRLIESKHAKVEVAENGLRAIEMFATERDGYYDAILMDIRMPVMDGLTAARSIRQLRKQTARDIPIIAMSANAFDEDVEKSKAAGMNAHLSKPIEPILLYATLDKFLHGNFTEMQP